MRRRSQPLEAEQCECTGQCGRGHADDDIYDGDIGWVRSGAPDRCQALNRVPHPVTGSRVALTIAHLDHDPGNNTPDNLLALCQRCHNAYDVPHRRATRFCARACGDPLFDGPNDGPHDGGAAL